MRYIINNPIGAGDVTRYLYAGSSRYGLAVPADAVADWRPRGNRAETQAGLKMV